MVVIKNGGGAHAELLPAQSFSRIFTKQTRESSGGPAKIHLEFWRGLTNFLRSKKLVEVGGIEPPSLSNHLKAATCLA